MKNIKNITVTFESDENGYNLVDKWKGAVKSMGITYKKRIEQIMEKDLNIKKDKEVENESID